MYGSGSSEWLASLVGKDERSIWSIRALAAAFLERKKITCFHRVFGIRIRIDLALLDPYPYWECGSGSKETWLKFTNEPDFYIFKMTNQH